uniref:Lymphocyte antigen 6 family member S n=1 Tax=Homo sapiens TaxID=9606 RepID=A0AAQ5BIF1_HUMAN
MSSLQAMKTLSLVLLVALLSMERGSALLQMLGGLGRGLLQRGLVPLPGWGLCLPESERLWQ